MATKLMFESDLGAGLAVEGGKAVVKVDGTSIGVNASGQLESLGGGGETFVASGAVANGAIVALRSDGKVEVVAVESVGSPTTYGSNLRPGVVFDSTNGRVVVAYPSDSNTVAVVVGTVSGTSISFGAPTAAITTPTNVGATFTHITFDSTNGRVVVAFNTTVVVGTVSGTSISFGTSITLPNACMTMTFDSTNARVVAILDTGAVAVGTVSGTSISFGTPVTADTTMNNNQRVAAAFDSVNGRVVIVWFDGGTAGNKAIVGTVSGTTISFGSTVTYRTGSIYNIAATFDATSGKIVVVYPDGWYGPGNVIVGTVSGTSISFGTPVVFNSSGANEIAVTYMSSVGKIAAVQSSSGDGNVAAWIGTVLGTSVSFVSPVIVSSTAANVFVRAVFDSTNGRLLAGFDHNSVGKVTVVNPQPSSNADSWVGVTKTAAADTETVPVALDGETTTNLTGLTTGAQYYVADDGTLTTTANNRYIGRALSSTKLRIVGSGKL